MSRAHRLGQTRPVKIIRYVQKDTIEEKIMELQSAKAMLMKGALQKLTPAEERLAKNKELQRLFDI